MHRIDLRYSAAARPNALARAVLPGREGFLPDRAVAFADDQEHARHLAAAYSGIFGARRGRRTRAATSHAELYEATVRRRKQGPVVFHAHRGQRVRREQKRLGRRWMDV